MSIFGALQSGISGLAAQSSAMGAISDNIANVNTIGYKVTNTRFSTLVTKQTTSTLYSRRTVSSASGNQRSGPAVVNFGFDGYGHQRQRFLCCQSGG